MADEVITLDQKKDMINGYNALVEDFSALGIDHEPYLYFIHEDTDISVEKLFFYQGLLVSKVTKHLEAMVQFRREGEAKSLPV